MITRTVTAFVLSCAALAGLSGCTTNPATGRLQFTLLPAATVAAMGAEAKPELISQYGGEIKAEPLRQYVDRVGRDLLVYVEPEFVDLDWEFIVLDSDVINAFALPGGKVFISRGLLARFSNEAQLAGVLGHEIGHVSGRHVDERISQAIAIELGIIGLGAATESELAIAGAQLFTTGYTLRFGRGQESEADELGLRYMVRAGYDPRGMLQVMEILRDASAGQAPPEFLSTHPHPDTRIATINRLMETEYAHTRNNPDYRLFPGRFEREARPYLGTPRQHATVLYGSCCGGPTHAHAH